MTSKKKSKVTVKLTTIEATPDLVKGEDAFTPITAANAYTKELRRLCKGYGQAQDLNRGCAYCVLQIRCLNVMRLGIPAIIEHFRENHFGGNPTLAEALVATTPERVEEVIDYAVEDIQAYQEEDDVLSQARVLKLFAHLSKEELKSVDPRFPVLLLEKLRLRPEVHVEGKGDDALYTIKAQAHV